MRDLFIIMILFILGIAFITISDAFILHNQRAAINYLLGKCDKMQAKIDELARRDTISFETGVYTNFYIDSVGETTGISAAGDYPSYVINGAGANNIHVTHDAHPGLEWYYAIFGNDTIWCKKQRQ